MQANDLSACIFTTKSISKKLLIKEYYSPNLLAFVSFTKMQAYLFRILN